MAALTQSFYQRHRLIFRSAMSGFQRKTGEENAHSTTLHRPCFAYMGRSGRLNGEDPDGGVRPPGGTVRFGDGLTEFGPVLGAIGPLEFCNDALGRK